MIRIRDCQIQIQIVDKANCMFCKKGVGCEPKKEKPDDDESSGLGPSSSQLANDLPGTSGFKFSLPDGGGSMEGEAGKVGGSPKTFTQAFTGSFNFNRMDQFTKSGRKVAFAARKIQKRTPFAIDTNESQWTDVEIKPLVADYINELTAAGNSPLVPYFVSEASESESDVMVRTGRE